MLKGTVEDFNLRSFLATAIVLKRVFHIIFILSFLLSHNGSTFLLFSMRLKIFPSPKRNRQFVFAPKIQYEMAAEPRTRTSSDGINSARRLPLACILLKCPPGRNLSLQEQYSFPIFSSTGSGLKNMGEAFRFLHAGKIVCLLGRPFASLKSARQESNLRPSA